MGGAGPVRKKGELLLSFLTLSSATRPNIVCAERERKRERERERERENKIERQNGREKRVEKGINITLLG